MHTERWWRPASLSNHIGFHRQVTLTVIRMRPICFTAFNGFSS
ncbi:hypothetical protein RISK_003199 [Rhodopirellula islandica]|uniref:Uncharacterized protein n=1 Tax=Rhodopirellula islandica TaxID=595434 RepID=A0A0J1BEI9_RHOIS|nr:hypothetical protein RISK_003199 [Rhodopirellula islandica]